MLAQYLKDSIPGAFPADQNVHDSSPVRSHALMKQNNGQNDELNGSQRPPQPERALGVFTPERALGLKTQPMSTAKDLNPSDVGEEAVTSTSTQNEEHSSLHRKRKPVEDSDNDTDLVSAVASNEPSAKNARSDDADEEQSSQESNVESSQDSTQMCVDFENTALNVSSHMLCDLFNVYRSQMNVMTTENSRLKADIEALKTEYEQKLSDAKNETQMAQAEMTEMKKEHDKKTAAATNQIEMARKETENMKSTLLNTIEKNRELFAKTSAEKQRIFGKIQEIEKKYLEEMNDTENKLRETILR